MEATYADLSPATEEASQQFIGQWRRLVSTTNWEKGRILCEWRSALVAAGAPATEYSDEAWAQRIGGVSSQHVGRLRRTFARFGESASDYAGLFWSHFQAALEWDDAEMWLEGAVQSGWSISQMRGARSEALGEASADAETIVDETPFDDDAPTDGRAAVEEIPRTIAASEEVIAERDVDDESDHDDGAGEADSGWSEMSAGGSDAAEASVPTRPFAALPELPIDLAEALESFKLAILRHKLAGWSEVSQEAVLDSLAALRQLALAPSEA
ncbi:MAG: hypothetical protein K1X71_02235 [Pirellulales bacterium]|nr:hypothetical protein [Pirellulales bacterium]